MSATMASRYTRRSDAAIRARLDPAAGAWARRGAGQGCCERRQSARHQNPGWRRGACASSLSCGPRYRPAGTVAALGPGVATFREGDEVHGMTAVSAACRDRSPNMLLSTRSPASAMWSARSDGRRIRSRRSLSVPAPILAYSRCCRSSAANAARITGKSYARRPNSSKLRFDPRRFNLSNVDAAHASVDDRSAKWKILVEFQ